MRDTNEMRQKRASLVKQARELIERAQTESRDLTTEEEQQYERVMSDVDKMAKDIEREERLKTVEKELEQRINVIPDLRPNPGETPEGEKRKNKPRETEEYRQAFVSYLRRDLRGIEAAEFRALQADSDIAGGYVTAPQVFVNKLIMSLDDAVTIRPLATKYSGLKGESLGVPSLEHDPADADWTKEIGTGSEDSTMDFGKRELRPHPLAKRIKVSNKLLRVGAIDVEALVRDRLSYKFSVTQEKAFLTGNGAEQPLGIFTASSNGISTSRDVSTGNTSTSIGADGLIEAKYKLKIQYWRNARWIFHRDGIKQIRKLKDGEGNYLWQPGLVAGKPDVILDLPCLISEFAPNTFTTGQYVGILGDFSFFWIVDALEMELQRLVELYAESNQTGFIGRMETDGMPVLEEAFARVTLA